MSGISIERLSKSFKHGGRDVVALRDIDLEIPDHRIVTLLGMSGSGKTTLLRLLAGHLAPDAGTIRAGGRLLSSPTGVVAPQDRGIAALFQGGAVDPRKTVYENVASGLGADGMETRRRVELALALAGLAGSDELSAAALSAAQQRRVALAQSLVSQPKILLLDEPLIGLDSRSGAALRAEIRQLPHRAGMTLICATHDPRDALALSDRVAVIDAGRVVQFGAPFDVYTRPASRAVASLTGPLNVLPGKVLEVRAGVGRLWASPELRLEIPVPAGTEPGDDFDIVVRPENIRLSRLLAPPTNGAGAKITDYLFLGNTAEYVATLGSGQVLHILAHPAQRFAIGDDVSVEIDTRHCIIFPRGAGDLVSLASTQGVIA